MQKTEPLVYRLNWDFSHLTDIEYDAESFTIKDTGFNSWLAEIDPDDYDFPERIYFLANFEEIPEIDYPVNTINWPIVSKRMLGILKKCGSFLYREIPIIMVDFTHRLKNIFDEDGKVKEGIKTSDDYIAIQILEYSDLFDYEKSEYDKEVSYGEERITHVYNGFFKKPKEGFPPLFRLPFKTPYLFISLEAKERLEAEGIKGVSFEPTKNF